MKKWLTLFMPIILLASCRQSSYITSSWKMKDYSRKSYRKIVVLGLIADNDHSIREKMEQHIAAGLKKLGYNAFCSCEEYNRNAFDGMNEEQAIAKLRNSGVDAVLTVVMLGRADEQYYVPARSNGPMNENVPNRFWDYYQSVHNLVGTQSYYVTSRQYFWETNLYELGTGKLVYDVKSRSFDPESADRLGEEYSRVIVKNMLKKKVLDKP